MGAEIPVIVLGCIGNCLDVVEAMLAHNRADRRPHFHPLGYLDDNPQSVGTRPLGLPVLGDLSKVGEFPEASFVLAIGGPHSYLARPQLFEKIGLPRERYVSVVHPAASVSRSSLLGLGSVLLPHVTVGAQARIGDHVMVLPNSVISHDVSVGDFTLVATAAVLCGTVEVGSNAYIGACCCIRQDLRIGAGALVGMGSQVVKDVPPGATVWGNPARLQRLV